MHIFEPAKDTQALARLATGTEPAQAPSTTSYKSHLELTDKPTT